MTTVISSASHTSVSGGGAASDEAREQTAAAGDRAADLLDDYDGSASFLFGSPRASILARGVAVEVPDRTGDRTGVDPEFVLGLLRSSPRYGLVTGLVPFDRGPARLLVPATVRRSGPFTGGIVARGRAVGPRLRLTAIPSRQAYAGMVAEAVQRIETSAVTKVVLARTLDVESNDQIDVATLVRNLAAATSHGYVFSAELPGDRLLVGGSPELMVRRVGRHVSTQPMAGSLPRSDEPDEDLARAAMLVESDKDRHEHEVVVDHVHRRLSDIGVRVDRPDRPSVVGTPTVWHLATRLTAELPDPAPSSLAVALALHPTPAIGGTPTAAAVRLINELEPFDRGYYGGMVGWMDAHGDGEWALSLRCAEVSGRRARLYAGAGIVAGSDPEREAAETDAKFATMLQALGVDSLESDDMSPSSDPAEANPTEPEQP